MRAKDAEGIANSVDPDQTAPLVWSGSALFVQACISENLGKLRYLIPRTKVNDVGKVYKTDEVEATVNVLLSSLFVLESTHMTHEPDLLELSTSHCMVVCAFFSISTEGNVLSEFIYLFYS